MPQGLLGHTYTTNIRLHITFWNKGHELFGKKVLLGGLSFGVSEIMGKDPIEGWFPLWEEHAADKGHGDIIHTHQLTHTREQPPPASPPPTLPPSAAAAAKRLVLCNSIWGRSSQQAHILTSITTIPFVFASLHRSSSSPQSTPRRLMDGLARTFKLSPETKRREPERTRFGLGSDYDDITQPQADFTSTRRGDQREESPLSRTPHSPHQVLFASCAFHSAGKSRPIALALCSALSSPLAAVLAHSLCMHRALTRLLFPPILFAISGSLSKQEARGK